MAFPAEVEKIIFHGFLTTQVDICGVKLILKSLSDSEHEKIDLFSFNAGEKVIYALAYSVFLFEQENVLAGERSEKISVLREFFKKLSSPIISELLRRVTKLNKKAFDTLQEVRRFAYLDESRLKWYSAKNFLVNSSTYTGIAGTDSLGLNYHQKLWYALNQLEDLKGYTDIAWNFVKIIISTQLDKKAFNKLSASDKRNKQEEEERRQRIIDGKPLRAEDAPRDSKEGLVRELQKSLSGDQDEHDLFIARYEKQLKEQSLKRNEEIIHLRKEFRERFGDQDEIVSESRYASEEDLQKIHKKKHPSVLPKKELPEGPEKLMQQMASLDPTHIEQIKQEVSQSFEERSSARQAEDDFFISSSSEVASEEALNAQIAQAQPGTPEYAALVRKLQKNTLWKLK